MFTISPDSTVNDLAWIIPLVFISLLLFYCVCCCDCNMNNQSGPRRNRDGDNGTDLERYDNWSDGFDGASCGGSGGGSCGGGGGSGGGSCGGDLKRFDTLLIK